MMAMALLLAVGTLFSAHRAAAADPKPALTIAFAGYDQLLSDLKALDELGGHAKLADLVEAHIKSQTQDKELFGLDKSRPWGVLVSLGEGDQPVVQGYLPIADLKGLLSSMPGEAPAADANGVYKLPVGDTPLFAKQKGNWAVFANGVEALDGAPADPTPAIADLAKKYLLSVRGSAQNVPEASRESALNTLRGILEFSLATQQSASEEQRAMVAANVKQAIEKLQKIGKELDTLVIGVGLDASSKSLFLDVETRGLEGSDLAKRFAALKGAKTDFAGFASLPGVAMSMLAAGTADDEQVADLKTMLANYRTAVNKVLDANEPLGDKKRDLLKQFVGDLAEVVEKTAELKKSDAGMAIVLEDGPAAVWGFRIAEGAKLEAAIKKLVAEIGKETPELGEKIKLDAEKYEGVNFHVVKIPLPDPEAVKVFGDSIQIVVGTGPTSLYLGAGKDPVGTIKKAIDGSKASPGKTINPVDAVISATPIAKFFAKVIPEDNPSDAESKKLFAKVAASLAKSGGKDHVKITVKSVSRGENMRLYVESGITKAILNAALGGGSDAPSDEN
jgi:hypothetical protein